MQASCALAVVAVLVCGAGAAARPKSVLYIAVDDMRPAALDVYNFNFSLTTHTPNMAAFAQTALTFDRAYVQYSYCAPSRNSFMTGRRPDTTRAWNFIDHFREKDVGADWLSMPEYFKDNGYLTLGGGKLFHPNLPPNNDWPTSWSPEFPYFPTPGNGPVECLPNEHDHYTWCAVSNVNRTGNVLSDQKITNNCIEHLQIAKNQSSQRPFFVGCGLHKPHVPWFFPAEFLEPFPSWEDTPLATYPYAPHGMPDPAWHFPADVRGFNITFNGTCDPRLSKIYRRAYHAATSYQDYNIGRILDELEALGLANDTVVLIHGDHGWQLGEKATWAKMTNFELGTKIPLMIRAPWKPFSHGQRTSVLAEMVDVYPTLAALTGLPDPATKGQELNGTSLEVVFDDPADTGIKSAAYSQFAKVSNFSVHNKFFRNQTNIMGYTVRVTNYRYTCWFRFDNKTISVDRSQILGRELYDHSGDVGDPDFVPANFNVVEDPARATLVEQLHQMILAYIQLKPVHH